MKFLYPGSFDPFTLGHLDIARRASSIAEELEILVSTNPDKNYKLDIDTRIMLIKEAVKDLVNVKVSSHSGLTVDYIKEKKHEVILRGMRGAFDFEMELEMSQVNNFLSNVETLFLMTSPEYSFIRASRVWELLRLGADIHSLVPKNVAKYLKEYNGEHL